MLKYALIPFALLAGCCRICVAQPVPTWHMIAVWPNGSQGRLTDPRWTSQKACEADIARWKAVCGEHGSGACDGSPQTCLKTAP